MADGYDPSMFHWQRRPPMVKPLPVNVVLPDPPDEEEIEVLPPNSRYITTTDPRTGYTIYRSNLGGRRGRGRGPGIGGRGGGNINGGGGGGDGGGGGGGGANNGKRGGSVAANRGGGVAGSNTRTGAYFVGIKANPPIVSIPSHVKNNAGYAIHKSDDDEESVSPSTTMPELALVQRGRPASNVSQSVSVLDLSASGKEKSAKPPRRLSIPTKSAISPLPRSTGMITPISETRMKRSGPGKDGTPASDVSKSNQRKFNMISSASYWLSQIKLSETASKHSISLGFFKLALESGCEPLQKMRDELKSYVGRHNLAEHGESAKEILRSYTISEDLEELQVSLTCSQVPEDGARSSDEDVQSSSVTDSKNFKPKSLNSESFQESAKKNSSKKTTPAIQSKGSANANSGNLKSVSNVQKNLQKSSNRQETNKVKAKVKGEQKKSDVQKDITDTSADQKSQQEDKENLGIEPVEEISVA